MTAVDRLDADSGWFRTARKVPSPNFDARPHGTVIDLIVIHAISLPPAQFGGGYIDDLFCNRLDPAAHPYFRDVATLRVSAHLLIERDGTLKQFVSTCDRAWHCGASEFRGRPACNDYSIGIELEGCDELTFDDSQYARLHSVVGELLRCHPGCGTERIVGHSDIAPGRKTDPGPGFDWARVRAGLVSTPARPERLGV